MDNFDFHNASTEQKLAYRILCIKECTHATQRKIKWIEEALDEAKSAYRKELEEGFVISDDETFKENVKFVLRAKVMETHNE